MKHGHEEEISDWHTDFFVPTFFTLHLNPVHQPLVSEPITFLPFLSVMEARAMLGLLPKQMHSTLLEISSLSIAIVLLLWIAAVLLFLTIKHFLFSEPSSVYLVDFSCLKPPNFCHVPFSTFLENASKIESFNKESLDFMAKILLSSGQGQETYLPPALHHIPPKTHIQESTKEVQMSLFPIITDLLSKTNVSPTNIDFLIVNCSGFCPSPSLASIIINEFNMRDDVKSYNLSGMGCSAGAIGIDLAYNLLKVHRNSNALILSTEILSTGWYPGNDRAKLLLNCLFRMGSAAILLSNRKEVKSSSKYKLSCTVRTQRAFEDMAYASAFREEDPDGNLGVTLNRDLLQVAGQMLRSNITILGSRILPLFEKYKHGISATRRRLFADKSGEIYVPNFKNVVQHFCLPTSGRPVIREIAKGLKLGETEIEAALMTLHRFGNQSSSSLWYELAYLEAKERVKQGDKVWQLGMGSGPKCCSVVWDCVKPIVGESNVGPWDDCIHRYPVPAVDHRR